MNSEAREESAVPSAADCAEAAAWIAKLHGEERSPQLEAGLRRWLAASDSHRAAFEMANELWVESTRIPKTEYPVRLAPERAITLTWPKLATAAAVLVGFALAGFRWISHEPSIATNVGEQRNIVLDDGTRVALNTESRIRVHYNSEVRAVELEQGEAFFDVAKRVDRPFVVVASGKKITALGTSFVVRSNRGALAVTLLDGQVAVSDNSGSALVAPQDALVAGPPAEASVTRVTMSVGQRMTFKSNKAPTVDRPPLEQVLAWQRGQVILDHTSLTDAIAEMNRYNARKLLIDSEQASSVRVTGVFRAGDSEEFARAVAENYGLRLIERSDTLVLSGIVAQR